MNHLQNILGKFSIEANLSLDTEEGTCHWCNHVILENFSIHIRTCSSKMRKLEETLGYLTNYINESDNLRTNNEKLHERIQSLSNLYILAQDKNAKAAEKIKELELKNSLLETENRILLEERNAMGPVIDLNSNLVVPKNEFLKHKRKSEICDNLNYVNKELLSVPNNCVARVFGALGWHRFTKDESVKLGKMVIWANQLTYLNNCIKPKKLVPFGPKVKGVSGSEAVKAIQQLDGDYLLDIYYRDLNKRKAKVDKDENMIAHVIGVSNGEIISTSMNMDSDFQFSNSVEYQIYHLV